MDETYHIVEDIHNQIRSEEVVYEGKHISVRASVGEAIDAPILLNGNTSTHIRFSQKPAEYMDRWFAEAPTHHLALSVGHNAGLFKKIAELMDIPYAIY